MSPEQIAKVCHEINRAYCQAIGDQSVPAWDDASVEQRNSCRNGVMFHLDHDRTPEESHANWMKQKLDEGWTFGPEKNEDVKTHPCLIPYVELPMVQKVKDHLFKATVEQLRYI